jgi:hypothetical protein
MQPSACAAFAVVTTGGDRNPRECFIEKMHGGKDDIPLRVPGKGGPFFIKWDTGIPNAKKGPKKPFEPIDNRLSVI